MYITFSDLCQSSMALATWIMALATVIMVIISINNKKK